MTSSKKRKYGDIVNRELPDSRSLVSEVLDRVIAGARPMPDKPSAEAPILPQISSKIEDRPKIEKDQLPSPANIEGPTKLEAQALQIGGPANTVGPAKSVGPLISGSPSKSVGPPNLEGLPANSLWRSVEPGGFTRTPNAIADRLSKSLDPVEQTVYSHLFRLSWGYGKDRCTIGFPRLAERSGCTQNTARRAAKGLVEKGLIEKLGMAFGKGIEQGIEFRVPLPEWAAKIGGPANSGGPIELGGRSKAGGPANSGAIKRDLKKQYLKIRADITDLFVGGSFDQFRAAFIRRCEGKGIEFDADLFKEIFGG